MPRTPEQNQAIRQQRKRQIMDTALRLFAENTYETTSIQQIANETGISKGLIYNYFSSKQQLMQEILYYGFQELFEFLDPKKDGILTEKEFIQFIEKSFATIQENISFWKFYMSLLMQPNIMENIDHSLWNEIDRLLEMLTVYYRSRGIKNPEAMAGLAGAILDGVTFDYILYPEKFPIEEIKELVIERIVKIN